MEYAWIGEVPPPQSRHEEPKSYPMAHTVERSFARLRRIETELHTAMVGVGEGEGLCVYVYGLSEDSRISVYRG